MNSAAALSEESRRKLARIVLLSRCAGVVVAAALEAGALFIQRDNPASVDALYSYVTIIVGLGAFVLLSTLTRIGHARLLEASITEVRGLTDQLRDLAQKDPLTGLRNLRAFHELMEAEIGVACDSGTSVSLIVADLDNFKLLNDSFGHQFGDAVLREAGRVFAAATLDARAARLGGDEFAILLPGATRNDAVLVARSIEATLAQVRFDERQPATLGSFGIGVYPQDGDTAQAMFASADARMYGEKHRRKAEALSSLAGAARKLFVRAGRAMRPGHTTQQILTEIAHAAREEFVLSCCIIAIEERGHHGTMLAVACADPTIESAYREGKRSGEAFDPAVLPCAIEPDAWRLDMPVKNESGDVAGTVVLLGQPTASFRPDPPVVAALADLVQAVVANSRAHVDAVRAGRERDIHVDLARALAGDGTLGSRLSEVARLVAEFVSAKSVAIQVLPREEGAAASYHDHVREAPFTVHSEWVSAVATPEWEEAARVIAQQPPRIIDDVGQFDIAPDRHRQIIVAAGVQSAAICPVHFGGEALGILVATSKTPHYFTEDLLAVLMTIAEHLAPAINVALLRDQLEASYRQLEQASRDSLSRLADAAEARDPHTGGHLRRIRHYSIALARELGLPEEQAEAIASASAIHDLGKLGLSDDVLLKPGKLTPDDWEKMREHPLHGERLLGDSPKFATERAVARWHHERWDGTGYPDGLRGEAIPIAARIVAVADAFDALTTQRPYKAAWAIEDAVTEIERTSGTLFCPHVVDALRALWTSGRLTSILAASTADDAAQVHEHHEQQAA